LAISSPSTRMGASSTTISWYPASKPSNRMPSQLRKYPYLSSQSILYISKNIAWLVQASFRGIA
jgi:hypothetical protein